MGVMEERVVWPAEIDKSSAQSCWGRPAGWESDGQHRLAPLLLRRARAAHASPRSGLLHFCALHVCIPELVPATDFILNRYARLHSASERHAGGLYTRPSPELSPVSSAPMHPLHADSSEAQQNVLTRPFVETPRNAAKYAFHNYQLP